MIQIKGLGPQDVGKWVEYRGGAGETERGRITSWTDKYVRVVYRCDNQWRRFQDFTGCANDPSGERSARDSRPLASQHRGFWAWQLGSVAFNPGVNFGLMSVWISNPPMRPIVSVRASYLFGTML